MRTNKMGLWARGATAAAVMSLALAGCTVGGPPPTATQDAAPSAVEYVPDASAAGAAVLESITDCKAVGEHFGALLDGMEPTMESVSDASVFCDWAAADDEETVFSVEVWPATSPVPAAEAVAASGGTVLEDPRISDAGGIVYAIAPSSEALALTVLLPEYSISATALNLVSEAEQKQQMSVGLFEMTGLAAS
ncbi:hypothetical protein JOF48_001525 [Arthrobacter stackebrandtii]|uniref:DUF3558 domain-containing protein n=1 Tax=Arthrobacter stackebrandtii TaxID=272161 RepID=A0ABS4YVB4_9MICC|nr:hypothetical protein [Arthrobacter stackebrandtii]MBP2412726.1 hypothetical protein [Arthrobacter stackebrandtii]PYG99912.1 hypothetical protein CVV67_13150 [Arthrobacter stackebrandtii]